MGRHGWVFDLGVGVSEFTYTRKLFGIFPITRTIPKPRLYRSIKGIVPCWVCTDYVSYTGFGRTPREAWNDWANGALI